MSGWTQALLIVAIVTTWLLFWVSIVGLLARLGGWRALSEAYPCDRAVFEGARFTFQSAVLKRWVSYNRGLTFTANGEGVRIAPFPFFKFGHRPILLPWSQLKITEEKRVFVTVVKLEALRVSGVPLLISKTLAGKLMAAAGESWPGKT
jgi:hypothetical protein